MAVHPDAHPHCGCHYLSVVLSSALASFSGDQEVQSPPCDWRQEFIPTNLLALRERGPLFSDSSTLVLEWSLLGPGWPGLGPRPFAGAERG